MLDFIDDKIILTCFPFQYYIKWTFRKSIFMQFTWFNQCIPSTNIVPGISSIQKWTIWTNSCCHEASVLVVAYSSNQMQFWNGTQKNNFEEDWSEDHNNSAFYLFAQGNHQHIIFSLIHFKSYELFKWWIKISTW